jgi:peptidoglycan/LPS O-acetylase OafA/YrhL
LKITGHPQEDYFWSWGPRRYPDGSYIGPIALGWAGIVVVGFILLVLILAPRGITSSMFSTAVLLRAGDISFSIYAVHPVVASWMTTHVIPSTLHGVDCLILILVGIWVTAEITHRCVEMPFMRLGVSVCQQIDGLAKRLEICLEESYHQVPSAEIEVALLEVEKTALTNGSCPGMVK